MASFWGGKMSQNDAFFTGLGEKFWWIPPFCGQMIGWLSDEICIFTRE